MIQPYSPKWPRTLDFLTPLSLQVATDPNLELYHYDATVSIPSDVKLPPKQSISTELGTTINVTPNATNKIKVDFGITEPNDKELRSQKEILEDIFDNIPVEIPDVITQRRGVVEKIPREVEDLEVFQGSEHTFYQQTKQGNYTRKLRRMFDMQNLRNPHEFIKGELLSHAVIKNLNDPIIKKMRSTLKTDWIKTDNAGYLEIYKDILPLKEALCERKWWQDIGIVHPLSASIDGHIFEGQVYWLAKRGWIVAV